MKIITKIGNLIFTDSIFKKWVFIFVICLLLVNVVLVINALRLNEELDDIKRDISSLEWDIDDIEDDIQDLETELNDVKNTVDDLEWRYRR